MGFFLSREENTFCFDDEGLTIFALRNQGVDLHDRKNWRGLIAIADQLGFNLDQNGVFRKYFSEDQIIVNFSLITRLVASIADWHQERRVQQDEKFKLTDEVERLLRSKGDGDNLEVNPKINVKGTSYYFDFFWRGTYVDAIKPRARSTGAALRKSILMRPVELAGEARFLVVIDDRDFPKKAKEEASVLGQVVKTMNYTNLEALDVFH